MQGKKHYNNKIKQNKTKYLVLLVLLTFIILGGIVFSNSRYVLKSNTTKSINSDKFYFNSDSLGEKEKKYNMNSKIIEFQVNNYDDELRYSNVNIEYEVTTQLISTNNSNITIETYINGEQGKKGTLNGNQKAKDLVKVEIKGASEEDNIELEISVIAKYPYSKKLSATYNIKKPETSDKEYEINLNKSNDYSNLLIRTYSYSGNLKIKFDKTKLVPYEEKQDNVTISDNYITINVKNNSNYSLKFITNNSIKLNEDIIVEK